VRSRGPGERFFYVLTKVEGEACDDAGLRPKHGMIVGVVDLVKRLGRR
jgi:hypothetical protein